MTHRPANPPRITQADMRPGDVILSCADRTGDDVWAELDRLILAIDQGDYTHASLWDGTYVIECLRDGVHIDDELALTLKSQTLVDVYRYAYAGHGLGDPGWAADPVLDAARAFEGRGYGYDDLVLLGVVLLTSEVPPDADLQAIVRLLGSAVGRAVDAWLGKEDQMVCSQVVAQAYFEGKATPAAKYALPIVIGGNRHLPEHADRAAAASGAGAPDELRQDYHRLHAELAAKFAAVQPPASGAAPAPKEGAVTVAGGGPLLPAGFVSPGDLQRSPALHLVGTLKQPEGGGS